MGREGGRGRVSEALKGGAPRSSRMSKSGSPPNSAGKLGVKSVSQVVVFAAQILDVTAQKLPKMNRRQHVLMRIFHHRCLLYLTKKML